LGAPAERDSPGALRIGSIRGIDVMVRTSWLLFAALMTYVLAPRVEQEAPGLGPLQYVAAAALAVLLTLALLLHEVSHAIASQHYGLRVRSITLHFIGGVTSIDGEPETPKQEMVISGVGPVTSLGIGGLAAVAWYLSPGGLLGLTFFVLAAVNLIIGVLNLLPGMPLDGGRLLRAVVWQVTGDPHRGSTVAGWAGRVLAVLMLLLPALLLAFGRRVDVTDVLVSLILAWFLWSSATATIRTAWVRSRLPRLHARQLARRTVTVPEDLPLAEAVRRAQAHQAGSIVTVDPAGRPAGIVSEAAVAATPEERRPWVPVGTVSRTLAPGLSLPADISGEELIRALQAHPTTEYLLVEPEGRVYGVLVTADVDAAFSRS
jgi:Zn-dependent protease/CBS domain-containing protein